MRCHLNFESYVRSGGSWRERVEMATERFCVDSMVCGYHVYKDVQMLLPSLQNSGWLKLSRALLLVLLSQPLYVRELAYDSLFNFEVFCCSLSMHLTSVFVAVIEEDRTSLAITSWGHGSF